MPAPTLKVTDYAYQKRPCFCAKGACLNCCNDVRGVVVDLTANVPAIGTYPTPDGGELEVLSVSMDSANLAHYIFGATSYPDGGTATQQAPSTICCYRPIGFVEWIIRDEFDAEVGHYFGCVWAGIASTLSGGGSGKAIDITFRGYDETFTARADYWFYRDINASVSHSFPIPIGGTKTVYPLQSAICAAVDFFELGNDLDVAPDTGAGLDIRATRVPDTGLLVLGEDGARQSCGNPCAISQELTLTLSTSGKVLYDLDGDEITAPDIDITFTVNIGCDYYNREFTSEVFDVSTAEFPDATAFLVITVYVDNEGRLMVDLVSASSGMIFVIPSDPEDSELGGSFDESFQIGTVTCGEITPVSGTVQMDFNNGTDGPYDITYTVT